MLPIYLPWYPDSGPNPVNFLRAHIMYTMICTYVMKKMVCILDNVYHQKCKHF